MKSVFIQERLSWPSDEMNTQIAKLEREVAALKCHQEKTQGRTPTEPFLLCVW
jgi:hypothetical protein